MAKIKFLTIAFWNANGLAQHSTEVKSFLNERKIDILLISETHFTSKNYLSVPNFKFYHVMHPDGTAHGGSAILIRDNIKHQEGQHFRTKEIQATNVVIEDRSGPITISSIYSPPRHTIKKEHYDSFFLSLGHRFLACGDYNAKHLAWGSRLITPKGRQLLSSINNLSLNITSPFSPTYWPTDINKIPDLIDFCVSKNMSPESHKCCALPDLSSDHSPVLLILNSTPNIMESQCKLHSRRTNWQYYKELVSASLCRNVRLKTEDDISNAIEHLVLCIQQAAWNSTPEQSFYRIPHYSVEARRKLAEKRKARKRWQITRYPWDKSALNRLTSELRDILQQEDNTQFTTEILNLDPTKATNYSLWKKTGKIKKQSKTNHPIRNSDNSWTKTNSEKAARFAQHLEEVFTPNEFVSNKVSLQSQISNFLNQTHQLDLPIRKFTKSEVKDVIRKLKPNKAPGYDLITPKTLKELPDEALCLLTFIYNACLSHCFFPPQWKVAEITMILKPGKAAEHVSSYRPISLLPILGKVLESLFLNRLTFVIDTKDLIPNHQFGFRKKHGTIEQVHRLVDTINHTFENGQYCTAAFLDISQAFDKVWHDGLLFKLRKMLPINYYLFLNSYISNRYYYVKENDEISSIRQIKAGVPQGSVLGPTLYLLYTSDLPLTDGVVIGTFADDTAALAVNEDPKKASHSLQKCIDNISSWLQDWRINVNETKSVQVTFTLKRETCPPITLNHSEIPQANEVKYLGIHLDKRLTWKKHIQTKRKALEIQLNKFKSLISSRSPLSLENKLLIYKCIIKPIWTYGIQLWGTASNSNMEILQRFQSKTLRKISNAPWFVTNNRIHSDLKIPTVKEEIHSKMLTYKSRIEGHPNPLAANLMSSGITFRRLRRRAPQDLLS